ncbi:MAG: hypothetical protein ACFKPT_14595 [Gloeotrichia echinulata GP01]
MRELFFYEHLFNKQGKLKHIWRDWGLGIGDWGLGSYQIPGFLTLEDV